MVLAVSYQVLAVRLIKLSKESAAISAFHNKALGSAFRHLGSTSLFCIKMILTGLSCNYLAVFRQF